MEEEILTYTTKSIITLIAFIISFNSLKKIGGGVQKAWIWLTATLGLFFTYEIISLLSVFNYLSLGDFEEILELFMSVFLLITVVKLKEMILK